MQQSFSLASTSGACASRYTWYPELTSEELPALKKELAGDNPWYQVSVNSYSIDENHMEDFNHWKEALVNRTQTFKNPGMFFDDENIAKLEPRGYIIYTRDPYYD